MASKKKPVKRKKPAAKLEIKLVAKPGSNIHYNIYRVSLGKHTYFLAGCRCLNRNEAFRHINGAGYYNTAERSALKKALDAVGKKVSVAAFVADHTVTNSSALPDSIYKLLGQ